LLAEMNAAISWTATTSTIDARATPRLVPASGGRLRVPGDMSSAANLLVAGALVAGSSVSLPQVGVNPGRVGLLEVMTLMGAPVVESAWDVRCGEPVAALQVNASDQPLSAVELGGDVIPRAIDELPLVAVLATQAHGRTIVRDAAELHHKESDRIAAIVEGLTKMGASAEARDDGFVVDGPTKLSGAAVDGRADHRIVMALAVAGLVADGETKVSDGDRVADSYPGFVRALVALGAEARTTD
jgi:3-phosphoshikimate 1-carboxyvinyltransferase